MKLAVLRSLPARSWIVPELCQIKTQRAVASHAVDCQRIGAAAARNRNARVMGSVGGDGSEIAGDDASDALRERDGERIARRIVRARADTVDRRDARRGGVDGIGPPRTIGARQRRAAADGDDRADARQAEPQCAIARDAGDGDCPSRTAIARGWCADRPRAVGAG